MQKNRLLQPLLIMGDQGIHDGLVLERECGGIIVAKRHQSGAQVMDIAFPGVGENELLMRQIVENTVKFRIQLKRQLKCRRIDICPLSGDQVVKVGNNRVKQIFFAALQDNFALQSFPQVADADVYKRQGQRT